MFIYIKEIRQEAVKAALALHNQKPSIIPSSKRVNHNPPSNVKQILSGMINICIFFCFLHVLYFILTKDEEDTSEDDDQESLKRNNTAISKPESSNSKIFYCKNNR